MGTLSNLTFGLFNPKPAQAQDYGQVGFGTGYTTGPQPIPTPFQPSAQGGNKYLTAPINPNSGAGPYVPTNAVPVSNDSGIVGFSNNARIAVKNTQPDTNPSPAPTPSSTTLSDQQIIDAYKKMGWNDPNAILADYRNTGGSKLSGSGSPPPTNKYTSTKNDPRVNDILNDPTAKDNFESSGMSMDEYLNTIDQEAASQNALLGGYETTANVDKLAAIQNLQGQSEQLKGKALTGKEDALSAARRLYSELQQGYKQRFGGASSAGEAAMALTGNEQQRQMAQTNRQYQQTISDIDRQAATALNTVQSEFRSRIDQINQNRTLVESQRLQARRSALQDLANKAFAIKQQQDAFKQNIALMQAQIDMQAKANQSNLNVNPTSTLTTTNTPTTASGNTGLQTVQNSIGKVSSGFTDPNDFWNSLGVGLQR